MVEFIADATATYVCGPSYGWQNVRLRAQSADVARAWYPAEPGGPGRRTPRLAHPADSARATGIETVLHEIGEASVAGRLADEWHALTMDAGEPPATYDVSYPTGVLHDVVTMTLGWCEAKGLTAFAEAGPITIVRHIDRAWAQQLAEPLEFAAQEAARVAEVRALVEGAG